MKSIFLICISLFVFSFTATANELTVDDFLAPPDMITAKISPSGKYVASVWNFEKERAVVIFEAESSKVITRFGDEIIRPYRVSWANDDRLLVKLLVPYDTPKVRRDHENKEDFDINDYYMFGRMISTTIDGKNSVSLMNDERSAKRNVNLANITHTLPKDPEHILMSTMRRERLTLYKVNILSGESERLVTGGRFTYSFVRDDKNDALYRYDYRRIAKTIEILRYNKAEDEWISIDTIYFDEDDQDKNKIEIEDLAGFKDGNLVYRKMNKETGFNELIMLVDGEREVLASYNNRDIVGVITSGIGSEVIGYTILSDVYRSRYFDESRQKIYNQVAKNFKGENFSFSNFAKDQKFAILRSWGSSNPISYFIYDIDNDSLTKLNSPYSSLPIDKLARGFKIKYPARDGKEIVAYLYAPPSFDGSKPLPLVVLPHGGPQWRDTLNYSDFTQFIATRGYIVVKPNFRGSTGYGKAFEKAGYKEWGGKMQEDLEDVVSFLAKDQLIDPNKVCIVGSSYGGYAALMGAVKTPDMYKCAISINGVTHLPEQVDYDLDKFESDELRTYIKESIGDPKKDAKMLIERSPALNAEKINAKVLLIHGDEDDVVPYEQSELMEEALKEANKKVEFITLEDTSHNAFRYREDTEVIYEAVERTLAESLKEEE